MHTQTHTIHIKKAIYLPLYTLGVMVKKRPHFLLITDQCILISQQPMMSFSKFIGMIKFS